MESVWVYELIVLIMYEMTILSLFKIPLIARYLEILFLGICLGVLVDCNPKN